MFFWKSFYWTPHRSESQKPISIFWIFSKIVVDISKKKTHQNQELKNRQVKTETSLCSIKYIILSFLKNVNTLYGVVMSFPWRRVGTSTICVSNEIGPGHPPSYICPCCFDHQCRWVSRPLGRFYYFLEYVYISSAEEFYMYIVEEGLKG